MSLSLSKNAADPKPEPAPGPAHGHPPQEAPPPPPDDAPVAEHDRYWLRHVYQGDRVKQMTLRALLTGCLIGSVMSFSNLYVGLKSGWGLGASITSAIVAFGLFSTWQRLVRTPEAKHFTVLENNTMQTAASSAAYMTSAGLVAAIPALYMTTGQAMSFGQTIIWLISVCCVGVVAAIPVKRKLINQERLRFPSGVACAETLRSLHAAGSAGIAKAKALGLAGAVAATLAILKEAVGLIPSAVPIFGGKLAKTTVALGTEVWTLGAGALIGLRVTTSMVVGAAVAFGVAPALLFEAGYITCGKLPPGAVCTADALAYGDITGWTLWPGVALMVSHSLVGLSLQLPRMVSGLARTFGQRTEAPVNDPELARLAGIELPMRWFWIGTVVAGSLAITVQYLFFHIPVPYGVLSVMLAMMLSFVAARSVGETDINPVGAMGKVTQLVFGGVLKGQIAPNLMAAAVTGGAASQAGDLTTDMKTGHLLGANPRFQFFAQLAGIMVGAVFATLAYTLLVDPKDLGGETWPAPAAQVWAGVAKLLSEGLDKVEIHKQYAIGIGLAVGGLFAVLEKIVPPARRTWFPSVTGIGISAMVPFVYSFNMWLGALMAAVVARLSPKFAAAFVVVIASGLIAGESLTGVAIKAYKILFGG